MKTLAEKINHLTNETGGRWGIVLEDLESGAKFNQNENTIFYAASVVKVPIMVAVFAAADENLFHLSDKIKLKREDLVGGSGVLQKMTPGTKLTIYDLVMLMIIQSDNTATNMLIDLVGKKYIRKQMKKIGLTDSTFYNKLMTQPVEKEASNEITAYEMAALMKKMVSGKIISVWACEQMIEILKSQQLQSNIPGKLPDASSDIIGEEASWFAAHKTGSVTKVRHDVGILYVRNQKIIFSVLSDGVDAYEAEQTMQNIGLEIYNYLLNKK